MDPGTYQNSLRKWVIRIDIPLTKVGSTMNKLSFAEDQLCKSHILAYFGVILGFILCKHQMGF